MSKPPLPESLRKFIATQPTRAILDIAADLQGRERLPYGTYWYRAIACMLLSGRIKAKDDGAPNMTDANRLGKEANFNPYLIERVGKFLVAADVLRHDPRGLYQPGSNLAAFWNREIAKLPTVARRAVRHLFEHNHGRWFWENRVIEDWGLLELLTLFFSCFRDRALLESRVEQTLHDFASLPPSDLELAARGIGLALGRAVIATWPRRLDASGRKGLVSALYTAEWAYYAEHEEKGWWLPSSTGLAMLMLGPPPPVPELATTFSAEPDLSVFAGAGLGWETLVPLFRYAKVQRIDQVYEFRLDRKKLAGTPVGSAAGQELRKALHALEPLPSTVEDVLGTKSRLGGTVSIRWCSALVEPESPDVLEAIRAHPRLKGYLETGAPPGYLLIKGQSDPDNFVLRCRELGFKIQVL